MSSISVYARMRPPIGEEKNEGSRITLGPGKEARVELGEGREKIFRFSGSFGVQTSQEEVWRGLGGQCLVERVLEGYHATLFAYGQTGSGKTYTIEGGEGAQEGFLPRALKLLFSKLSAQSGQRGWRASISFIQIYNEAIYDLLDGAQSRPLRLRWNKVQQFTVEDVLQGQCRTQQEALGWWKRGQKRKIMGSHKMNNTSSRSHCLLTLRLQTYPLEDPSQIVESKLQIVDLAGSERQKVTKATGVVFREGIEINKSLFTLRQVISALYQAATGKAGQIPPYRDSKLTSLLKQSIGGNSYCAMVACINPTATHFQESVQTLNYAAMASYISTQPHKNYDPKVEQNLKLKQHNQQLQGQIASLQQHIQQLTKLLQLKHCHRCENINPNSNMNLKQSQTSIPNDFDLQEYDHPKGLLELSKSNLRNQQLKAVDSQMENLSVKQIVHVGRVGQKQSAKQVMESIGMIRDLIAANASLRQRVEEMRTAATQRELQTYNLMKQNQVLRERWEMLSLNLRPQGEFAKEEAPIAMLERMMRQQRGEGLRMATHHTQNSQKAESEAQRSNLSYNQFLKSRKPQQQRRDPRRKNRIYSQAKRIGHDSFIF